MIKKWFLLVVIFCSIATFLHAQDAKFKALFLYNFTKYLEWPAEKQKGDFIIGVYGSTPLESELTIIADKKKVGSQSIIVKQVNSPLEMKSCNILYVPENRSAKLEEVVAGFAGNGTVIITDKAGLAKTVAGLNYIKVDGKQSFEINKKNLEKQGVKVNSVLLSLGISVE